jgi:hypothetical protein
LARARHGEFAGQQNGRSEDSAADARTAGHRPAEAATAATTTTAEEVGCIGLQDVQFDALRNAIYHTARCQHFGATHRWLMLLIVATGTAGIANFAEGVIGVSALAAAGALLAALDLVLDLKGKASQHDRLKQEYYTLLAAIETTPQPDQAKVRRWRGSIIRLTAKEPRTYRAADAIAYNDAVDALGRDRTCRLKVPFFVAAFAHVWPFGGYSFLSLAEVSGASRHDEGIGRAEC